MQCVVAVVVMLGGAPVGARNGASMRVKDVASLVGVRATPLIGYGLVIGLNRTGDKRQTLFTNLSLANTLERFGVVVTPEMMKVENIAAVMVSAELPPFARPGVRLDITRVVDWRRPQPAGRHAGADAAARHGRPGGGAGAGRR